MSIAISYSLMLHGGAGELPNAGPKEAEQYLDHIRDTLERGRKVLATGGSALEISSSCSPYWPGPRQPGIIGGDAR